MATFEQNIRKIRGEAIHGKEVRTAIADAVQQVANVDFTVDGNVFVDLRRIGTSSDYTLEFIQES